MHNKKGFTLIEMLVVIAIIAVLVSIIVPTMASYTTKAKAAVDAANLRTVLGELNIYTVDGQRTIQQVIDDSDHPTSVMDPDAVLYAVFDAPGFIDVFYVKDSIYYSLDYLSDVAQNGSSSISTSEPNIPGGTWYVVSGG